MDFEGEEKNSQCFEDIVSNHVGDGLRSHPTIIKIATKYEVTLPCSLPNH